MKVNVGLLKSQGGKELTLYTQHRVTPHYMHTFVLIKIFELFKTDRDKIKDQII